MGDKEEVKSLIIGMFAEKIFRGEIEKFISICPHCDEVAQIQMENGFVRLGDLKEGITFPKQGVCQKCGGYLIVGEDEERDPELCILDQEDCWKVGGLKYVDGALGELACFSIKGACPHILDCYKGLRKPNSEGGGVISEEELKNWVKTQEKFFIETVKEFYSGEED